MRGQSRESAWGLLTEYTQSESLLKHAKAVEACMLAYAQKLAREQGLSADAAVELEQKYRVTGLLHDFDYERFPTPEQHPFVGNKILEERGYPEDVRRAILSHADYTNVPRETYMEKVGGIHHCHRAGETLEVAGRSRCKIDSQEDEGQGLRPQRLAR